jgi:hypothetical protein
VASPWAHQLHCQATDYGKSPADYLIPRAPNHLKFWFDQAIWLQGHEIAQARQRAASDPRPATGGQTATAAGGDIEFHGHAYWEDAADTPEQIAEDLRRYPIGGPTKSVHHALA